MPALTALSRSLRYSCRGTLCRHHGGVRGRGIGIYRCRHDGRRRREHRGADAGTGNITSPPSAQVYTVVVEVEVSVAVAVAVYPAAVTVVVYVTATVMGSVLVLGAAVGIRTVLRPPESVVDLREVRWTVGALGIRESEIVTVLWLDGDAAPLLTATTAGVGSSSALKALVTMSKLVDMAVTSAFVDMTFAVS